MYSTNVFYLYSEMIHLMGGCALKEFGLFFIIIKEPIRDSPRDLMEVISFNTSGVHVLLLKSCAVRNRGTIANWTFCSRMLKSSPYISVITSRISAVTG